MITTLLDFLFLFNVSHSDVKREVIEQQLLTLKRLYLHPFEIVMVSQKDIKHKTRLYEDPKIDLLCPFEVKSEALCKAAFSRGILERCEIGYDNEKSQFTLCQDPSELLEMFSGSETLIFVELPTE